MDNVIFSQVLALAIAVATTMLNFWSAHKANQRQYNSSLFVIIKTMLKNETRKALRKGYVRIEDLETIQLLNKEYHAMGGNGTIAKLVRDVEKLPVKPIDEA